ncbi:hypothetical protein GC197_14945 [bacterium]|nr:hypothetical protein [bacterium]
MFKTLFWNLKKNPIADLVGKLANQHDADLVILAECHDTVSNLLDALNPREARYRLHDSPSRIIRIFSRLPKSQIRPVYDDSDVSIRVVRPLIGQEFILVAAHLGSKMYLDEHAQASLATRVARQIYETEEELGHSRTVVVGDLNMNPFEKGLVDSESFHAVLSRDVALEKSRTVHGKDRRFFYNPMWSEYAKTPPGTYFYRNSTTVCYFWNIFDQVLVRPDLIELFLDKELAVLSRVGTCSLLKSNGRPDEKTASDHLPLKFAFDFV